ncbi:collagen alpha-1(I) chain-like [Motacilla alba alba]|uniref:collagen alpha-1(I) chain-like n=1 Tax=Motacilla alba alba TaxID=1094192 RepID=UPI0018D57F4D|nr:collagen alpha-1(I) chain-like [Motacilla alba alba]
MLLPPQRSRWSITAWTPLPPGHGPADPAPRSGWREGFGTAAFGTLGGSSESPGREEPAGAAPGRWRLRGPEGRRLPLPHSGHRRAGGTAVLCAPHRRDRAVLCCVPLTAGIGLCCAVCPSPPGSGCAVPPSPPGSGCAVPPHRRDRAVLCPPHRRAGRARAVVCCAPLTAGHSAEPPGTGQARSRGRRPAAPRPPRPAGVLTGRGQQRRAGSPHPAGRGGPAQDRGGARAGEAPAGPRRCPGALRGTAPRPLNPRGAAATGRGEAAPMLLLLLLLCRWSSPRSRSGTAPARTCLLRSAALAEGLRAA